MNRCFRIQELSNHMDKPRGVTLDHCRCVLPGNPWCRRTADGFLGKGRCERHLANSTTCRSVPQKEPYRSLGYEIGEVWVYFLIHFMLLKRWESHVPFAHPNNPKHQCEKCETFSQVLNGVWDGRHTTRPFQVILTSQGSSEHSISVAVSDTDGQLALNAVEDAFQLEIARHGSHACWMLSDVERGLVWE